MAIRSEQRRNAYILRDLAEGYRTEAIARLRGVDIEHARRVVAAYRSARGMLSAGCRPQAVYANFSDLLTKKACGL